MGTGDILGDRLAQPIHVPQRDVGLPKRNCDAGFVEGIEDGDPQIRARAAGFVEVVNERVELEIESWRRLHLPSISRNSAPEAADPQCPQSGRYRVTSESGH